VSQTWAAAADIMAPLLRLLIEVLDVGNNARLAPAFPDKCIEERNEKRSDSWGLELSSLWASVDLSWSSSSVFKM